MRRTVRNNLVFFIILALLFVLAVIVTPVEWDPWLALLVIPIALFAYLRGLSVKHVTKAVKTVTEAGRQIRWAEIRKSMATSLNTAFGLTIGLVWSQVVTLGFAAAGLPLTPAAVTPFSWGLFVAASFGVTIICLVGIYTTARWKEATEEKEEEEEKEKKK